jgi:hypothetical protein
MAKKRRATAKRRVTRKTARRRRTGSPDTTVNTLVVLVVIVLVLGGLYLYAQNKKQAALWPGIMQTIGTLIAPIALPPIAQPASTSLPPLAQSAPITLPPSAQPPPVTAAPPEITGSVQTSQTTASARARHSTGIKVIPAAPTVETRPPAAIAVVPSQDH